MIQAEIRRLARALASRRVLQEDAPRFYATATGEVGRERAALPRPS